MFKLGLLIASIGVLVVLAGGGLVAYSQLRDDKQQVLANAFASLSTPQYDPVVALVNGGEIAGSRVQFGVAIGREAGVLMPGALDTPSDDPQRVLDMLVNLELMYQEAERRGLLCSASQVREMANDVFVAAPYYAELWAAHLGISVDDLAEHPEVSGLYSRLCASSSLWRSVLEQEGVEPFGERARSFWETFVLGLRQEAEIEIVDPRLQ